MKSESEITDLMRQHDAMARYISHSFRLSLGKFLSDDDRLSVAREGLWRAIVDFDPTREGAASFRTFANRTIVRRFLAELRYWYTRDRASRVRASRARLFLRTDDINAVSETGFPLHQPADEGHLPDLLLENALDAVTLGIALKKLRRRERTVLERRFWEGQTFAEIAVDFGVSRERIRQIEAEAVSRLRSLMKVRSAMPRKVAP